MMMIAPAHPGDFVKKVTDCYGKQKVFGEYKLYYHF